MKIIKSFDGPNAFLSNFYPSLIVYRGREYRTVEHFFQAHKTPPGSPAHQSIIDARSPGQAKRLGRKLSIHQDWDKVKIGIMLAGVRRKFDHLHLQNKLLDTKQAILVEGNTWGDQFWGQVDGQGLNMLGTILMMVRQELEGGFKLKIPR